VSEFNTSGNKQRHLDRYRVNRVAGPRRNHAKQREIFWRIMQIRCICICLAYTPVVTRVLPWTFSCGYHKKN